MKIAIFTSHVASHPGYSLTGIAKDQLTMLNRYGHDTTLLVCEGYNDKHDNWKIPVKISPTVPRGHLCDYNSMTEMTPESKALATRVENFVKEQLLDFDIILTHDLVFQGWQLPYAMGIKQAGLRHNSWFHWCHSLPGRMSDWWRLREFGSNHKLIVPTPCNRVRFAEAYHCLVDDVRVVPHIKDIRTFWEFDDETWRFVDDHPNLMQAEIVQVYPASCDRLEAKQVQWLIPIFAGFKRRNIPCCLVVANQWATGRQQKERLDRYIKLAEDCGLEVGHEFIFTSLWDKKYNTGLPQRILRELLLCSNLFIYPTREETFGLVGPEAALCGTFPVMNASLDVLYDVFHGEALYCSFGSHNNSFLPCLQEIDGKQVPNWEHYLDQVSLVIAQRLAMNEMWRSKTLVRRHYNMDAVYLRYYEPMFTEAMRARELCDSSISSLGAGASPPTST